MKLSKELFAQITEERGYTLPQEKMESVFNMLKNFEKQMEELQKVEIKVNEPVTKFIAGEES